MNLENRDFDKDASSWDANPVKVKLPNDVADNILKRVALTPDMDAMDFGCGTGLLTLRLQPFVRSITGVDSSQGMLDVLNDKISALKLENVSVLRANLDKGDVLAGRYDLITSSMALHHVPEVMPLLNQFHNVLAPAGHLCIADLDLDNGKFHEDKTGVFHNGFDREALRQMFVEAGFEEVQDTTAAEVQKAAHDGEIRRFKVFLMIGRKKQ